MAASSPTLFSPAQNGAPPSDRPPSPTAPQYSPITPTMSVSLPVTKAKEASQQHSAYPYGPPPAHVPSSPDPLQIQAHDQSQFRPCLQQQNPPSIQTQNHTPAPPPQEQPRYPLSEHIEQLPPSQPISESDNPDAIALRAAMSVLQIQRQQALRDLKKLEAQKEAALRDPEGFARAVQEGRVQTRGMRGVGPYPDDNEEDEDGEGDGDDTAMGGLSVDTSSHDTNVNTLQPISDLSQQNQFRDFGEIPSSQNVVRMPPINWSQYHVVGESLDKLHEEQKARPSPGQPARDEDLRPRERAPETIVAGPYNPWVDKVGTKEGRTRGNAGGGGGKKKKL